MLIGAADATVAVPEAAQAVAVAALAAFTDRAPLVVVTATGLDAERLRDDLTCLIAGPADRGAAGSGQDVVGAPGGPVALLPAWETLPFERVSPEIETMGRRLALLDALTRAPDGLRPEAPRVIVTPVRALLQRIGPLEGGAPLHIRPGQQVDVGILLPELVARGYRREHQVEHRGEFAVRGGIVDIFPSTADEPVRIDLWGDEVDRLTAFAVSDQRSSRDLEAVVLYGCRELMMTPALRAAAAALTARRPWGAAVWERLAAGEQFDGMESWLPFLDDEPRVVPDLLPAGAQVVLLEPRRIRDRGAQLLDEEAALAETLAATWGATAGEAEPFPRLHVPFDRLLRESPAGVTAMPPVPEGPSVAALAVRHFDPVAGDPARLAAGVTRLVGEGYAVTLCAATAPGAARLAGTLAEEGVHAPVLDAAPGSPGVTVVVAPIGHGFILPDAKVAVLSETDVTGRRVPHRRARPRARATDGFFDDLEVGSFVVHRQHGVARFEGVTTRTMGGTTRDYLILQYRGSDRLYLPVDQIEAITPYSGGESPTLSKMGGADWQRTRARARAAAGEVAAELVQLYRRRLSVEGHAFAPDTPWQAEMEAAFPFVETEDQLNAITDVKRDMEEPRPMDRLVCGDVGFGKTEVAVRAVFKAVQDGRQAAILAPTTLLASQHAQTFADRYGPYPVRVELLSRFLSPAEQRAVVQGLADGSVDVVIGTHRLLAEDVVFKQLGLLVVDEEQRFGVSHKEAVKRLSEGVDVLTLTASPIPRTLEMALTGIRDLSMVNTPPADRRPILTYVGEQDPSAVSEALRRELLREGQAFYVHNRVSDIDRVARDVRELVPEARVVIAHGQMDEGSLETAVLDFWERRYDVLVCTTIIESGIDMPSVNTLIVDRADLLGLGQLHQIRGRVGRAGQRAYAYLFHPADRVLSEQAYERLRTIGEHTELGSGFKIAMRDLEIRGAGNLLGSDQSGHIAAVGYDLYVQLVAEAVAEARGEPRPAPPTISLDVPGDAHLPKEYVMAEDARLEAYRRLASAVTLADVDDIGAEWADRYGPLPAAAEGLLALARLRASALTRGITEIATSSVRPGGARHPVLRVSPVRLPVSTQVRLRRVAPGATYREEMGQLLIPVTDGAPAAACGTSRDRRPDRPGRCRYGRGLCVACAAREATPRPPRRPRSRPGRRGAVRAHQRGRRERHRHQPAIAQLGRERHRRQRLLPVLPELAGVPVVPGPTAAARGHGRRQGAAPDGPPDGHDGLRGELPRHRNRASARRRAGGSTARHGHVGPAGRCPYRTGRADHERHAAGPPDGAGAEPARQLHGQRAAGHRRPGAEHDARVVRRPAGAVRRHGDGAAGGPGRGGVDRRRPADLLRGAPVPVRHGLLRRGGVLERGRGDDGGRRGRLRDSVRPGDRGRHPAGDDPVRRPHRRGRRAPNERLESRARRDRSGVRPRRPWRGPEWERRRLPHRVADEADADALRRGQVGCVLGGPAGGGEGDAGRPDQGRAARIGQRRPALRDLGAGLGVGLRALHPPRLGCAEPVGQPGRRRVRLGQPVQRLTVARLRPHVTVVGLGPAGTDLLGAAAARLSDADRVYLRTARHPAAGHFVGAHAFDDLYDAAATFDEVYAGIVEALVVAAVAAAPESVVYAVPGSPLVAERTVELLREDGRVDVAIVPALSFLDLAWAALGIDPLAEGVRLVDATEFASVAAHERGPFLIAQCWSSHLVSEVKLGLPDAAGPAPPRPVLLHHLGLADEVVEAVDWWELDRTVTPDHLTSLYVPAWSVSSEWAAGEEVASLVALMATLRQECPWDQAQTHASLMPHLIEESYEVLDALAALPDDGVAAPAGAGAHLEEELGDLLFQIVFHARLAEEAGQFDLADVARAVHDKLVHRHPHVFGDVDAQDADQVASNWEEIKKSEKGRTSVTEGIPAGLPALMLTTKLARKARAVGVDPQDAGAPETLTALVALAQRAEESDPHPDDPLSVDGAALRREVGELLFAVATLAQRVGVDAEQALRDRALSLRAEIRVAEGVPEREMGNR